jgi:hypothetical protein
MFSTNGGAMKEKSRIRFNPGTKEIEIEGSEEFVKAYFNKIQDIISGASSGAVEKTIAVKVRSAKAAAKRPKAVKVAPEKKEPKAAKPRAAKEVKRTAKKKPRAKKVTNIDKVVGLIQGSAEGISTSELKEKTGLAERQIWSIVNRASKLGKIKKVKRGVYGAS